jgi:uncharacterized protein YfaS (alpha-2-macroglobulin family)
MEQTSAASYPNTLVATYLKKARRANPEQMMKATQYLNTGYQKILTFETKQGGFGWWAGQNEPVTWVTAYGLQQLVDMSTVTDVDPAVIERVRAWLISKQNGEGAWTVAGATHGEAIDSMRNTFLPLTAYVTWTLADTGFKGEAVTKGAKYIKSHLKEVDGNLYGKALAAVALAAADPKDQDAIDLLAKLDDAKVEQKDHAYWRMDGQTFSYARGEAGGVEATALIAIAMLKTSSFTPTVNKVLGYLVGARHGNGAWGSTQATILALKALVQGMGGRPQKGDVNVTVNVNGTEKKLKITEDQAEVLQLVDFKEVAKAGDNTIEIKVEGESTMMYQFAGRYYTPWANVEIKEAKRPIEVAVTYDRAKLAVNDTLKAKVELKYTGDAATYMVIVDLGLPPGFQVDTATFEEMVEKKQLMKYTMGGRTATLYFGAFKPGDSVSFEYSLKAKYPVKMKTPETQAYEYYTPKNRNSAKPVELEVTEK